MTELKIDRKAECEKIMKKSIEKLVEDLEVFNMKKQTVINWLNGGKFENCNYCDTPNQNKISNVKGGGEMYICLGCARTYFKYND